MKRLDSKVRRDDELLRLDKRAKLEKKKIDEIKERMWVKQERER